MDDDLGRPAGGDTARHIKTLQAMLRVEQRQIGMWRLGLDNTTVEETRHALAFYNARVAALEAAVKAMRKQKGAKT